MSRPCSMQARLSGRTGRQWGGRRLKALAGGRGPMGEGRGRGPCGRGEGPQEGCGRCPLLAGAQSRAGAVRERSKPRRRSAYLLCMSSSRVVE